MWNSIKNLFRGPSKEPKNNESQSRLIQDLESCKETVENQKNQINAIIRDNQKLKEEKNKYEQENRDYRMKEEKQTSIKSETKEEQKNSSALKQKQIIDDLRRNNDILSQEYRNTHYNEFIRRAFEVMLNRKEKENPHPPLNNHIILDACIILDPSDSDSPFPHESLLSLLNKIADLHEKNLIQPILYKTLIFEYTNIWERPDLTVFPALELYDFFNRCTIILDNSKDIQDRKNRIEDKISSPQKQEFLSFSTDKSKQFSFHNDIRHAAIAQKLQCPLVTNDKSLLRLAQNPHNKMKIFHNSSESYYGNFPHIDDYLNKIGKNNIS